ncbi:ODA2 [Symbiodinium sp. KB8]|nr:ODA2 [Symbiodinium sp. KB8]
MEPDRGCGSAPPGLEVGVDVGTLRKLLMEQSDRIRESGDRVLGEAITKIQQKHEEYFVLIDAKVQQLLERCNSLASRLRMLEEGQHFAETKEDAQDNLGTGGHTAVEQDLRKTKQKSRRRGRRAVNKDKSGSEAPMISGEKDISGDLTLLGVEGFDSGSENSLSKEDTKCTGSWAKDGADGCIFAVGAGNTDNSRTADLGWKPKHMRSWNGCKWGRGWYKHHGDADSWSRHQCKNLRFPKVDWRHHWRSWEYPSLEKCQKSLESYLEGKRNKKTAHFPKWDSQRATVLDKVRFYFTSDPVLLKILSQGSDPESIQEDQKDELPHVEETFERMDTSLVGRNELHEAVEQSDTADVQALSQDQEMEATEALLPPAFQKRRTKKGAAESGPAFDRHFHEWREIADNLLTEDHRDGLPNDAGIWVRVQKIWHFVREQQDSWPDELVRLGGAGILVCGMRLGGKVFIGDLALLLWFVGGGSHVLSAAIYAAEKSSEESAAFVAEVRSLMTPCRFQ